MLNRHDELLHSAILIVDDEPANVMLLEHMLEEEGYTNLRSTSDPRQVVELHRTHRFDLILLDIRMPRMSGIEVLRALAGMIAEEWIPVLVLTAQTDDETHLRALEAGARDYLNKPFKQWEAMLRIRNMLETRLFYKRQFLRAEELEKMVRLRTREIREAKLKIIERLGRAGEYRDNETGSHVIRMSQACQMLALAAGLSLERAELIRYASPMHDVGKIGIADSILLKPGRLDPEERRIMEKHVQIGADIVGVHGDDILDMARTMALYHHEKWDGTGYPSGLKGEAIPLEARIASICDVFDALTSIRPYKDAWTPERALEFINAESGKHFDPELVKVFNQVYPDIAALREMLPD